MSEPVITCQQCGAEIELTDAIAGPIRRRFEIEAQQRRAELESRERKLAEHESRLQREQADREAAWKREQGEWAAKLQLEQAQSEAELKRAKAQQDAELTRARAAIDEEVSKRVRQEREGIALEEARKASEQVGVELRDLKAQLSTKSTLLVEAQERELEYLRLKRELEERDRESKLQMARQLDEERNQIRQSTQREMLDEFRLKEAEKDQQLAVMRRQIDDLKQKAEQGSQQAQGEVMELELERLLQVRFPRDTIEPVAKGVRGADALQRVKNGAGQECGTILWESKRTKQWNDQWLPKLRDDQRGVGADVAAIVSQALPRDVPTFDVVDHVWVCRFDCLPGLAAALRHALIEAHACRQSQRGRQGKMEVLYEYLAGSEFRQRVEAILESFRGLREDMEKEKRAMQRSWAAREKQIDRILTHTVGLHGDVAGIIGADLKAIESLDFQALGSEEP
ncbi:MAG: DUF2130 domain-containing protein [Phycisphaerales bacterium]|nr:DUF2130 domain-containing protein [Phycisphaerales bacterium]